jgi:hypothetical protein
LLPLLYREAEELLQASMQRALMEGIQSAQLADGKEPSKGLFFIRVQ